LTTSIPVRSRRSISPSSIPFDLTNTALEYAGIYDDGWLTDTAFVGLGHPDVQASLVVSVMVPLIDDPDFTTELRVSVDGQVVRWQTLGLGDTELRLRVRPGEGRRRVALRFSALQQLPGEQVPRLVAALLRSARFEIDDSISGSPCAPPA
jgi:hypothetical protein